VDNEVTTGYVLSVQNVRDLSGNTLVATNIAGVAHGFDATAKLCANGLAFAFDNRIVVHADGADIFGASDQFQFVYRRVSGDFDVAVRVQSLLNTDASAKAGLMARLHSGFDPAVIPESRNIMIEATPGRFIFQYRTNAVGANSVAVASPRPPTAFPNSWVRLVRAGAVFTAYSSTNHGAWNLMGSYDTWMDAEGEYPDEILLGLAVTSSFEQLAILANLSTLLLYGTCCLATWELRRRDVRAGGTPFRVPAPGLVVALACLVIGWMLTGATRGEWTALAICLAIASAIFLLRRRNPDAR